MSRPCPFCGDARPPQVDKEDIRDGQPPIFCATCQCCGAQGPFANSAVAAAELWERHWPEGKSVEWREHYSEETSP